MWPCADASHQNEAKAGKYHWQYNATTGLVKSLGSERARPTKPFCIFISKPDSVWKQRVKIRQCDAEDTERVLNSTEILQK